MHGPATAAATRPTLASMRPTLRALAASQGGVFTRRQAKLDGCSEREIKTRTGPRGDWVVVRRGVYAERFVWESADDVGRYELEGEGGRSGDRGHLRLQPHVGGDPAGACPPDPRWHELVHVTRPDVLGGRVEGGVKHHKGWRDADVVMLDDLPVTSLARTAVDVARELGFEDGVVAADAALRLGATQHEIGAVLQRMESWPFVTRARAAADVADGGAETIGETLTRLLVLELGIGRPETQFEVWSEGRHAFVDLKLRRHFIEFDGKIKYLGREQRWRPRPAGPRRGRLVGEAAGGLAEAVRRWPRHVPGHLVGADAGAARGRPSGGSSRSS